MMRVTVLDRHLATAVVGMSLLALLALALIAGLTTVIDQLGDVGKGRFGIADAVRVALLTLPSAVYELFPMAVLLGSLLGLGALAANGELVAMRAAGWSVARMARAVALAGLAASVLVIALGEWVVPPAERLAVALKARAHVNGVVGDESGVWIRDGAEFIHIGTVRTDRAIGDIRVFRLDSNDRLTHWLEAESGYLGDQGWVLRGVREVHIADAGLVERRHDVWPWPARFRPDVLRVSVVDPETMSLAELAALIDYLQANGLDTARQRAAYWSKWVQPLATAVMVLLGLPFVFGRFRDAGVGLRLIIGILFGVLFYIANTLLGRMGVLYGLPPLVSVVLPTAVFLLAGLWAIARIR